MSGNELEATPTRIVLAVGLGLACMLGGGYLLYDAVQTATGTEEVDAEILTTGVSGDPNNDYRVQISYEYTYGGESYTSDNVFPGTGVEEFSSRGSAEDFVAEYPEGETVTAYVDPDDPSSAHLEAEIPGRNIIGYGVVFVIGLVAFLGGLKMVFPLRAG